MSENNQGSVLKAIGSSLFAGGVFLELYRKSKQAESALVSAAAARKERVKALRTFYSASIAKCDQEISSSLPPLLTQSIETFLPVPSPAEVCFFTF